MRDTKDKIKKGSGRLGNFIFNLFLLNFIIFFRRGNGRKTYR